MTNFQFLRTEWPAIYREAQEAEQLTLILPKACVIICRSALEKVVNWLYDHDYSLERPYDTRLGRLIHEQPFRELIRPGMFREVVLIKKNGDNGAHGSSVSQGQALASIKNLFRFCSFLVLSYGEEEVDIPPFDDALLPDGQAEERSRQELAALTKELEKSNAAAETARKEAAEMQARNALLKRENEAQRKELTQRREAREKVKDPISHIPELIPESVTRKLYIDVLLKEAGWDNLREGIELEYEVKGMPTTTNPSGLGYVDYVLWGKDGKPLAVVEAKKTMADARKGRHQAELYADCLEQMHRQRPIIFYTNGFETFLWDDQFYVDRPVDGFYTQDELQLLIDRHTARKDIRRYPVNRDIAGRAYQLEAIQRVAENLVTTGRNGQLRGARRESLLVMATGSGKTRTAIAIVDLLTKCDWVKRVLFLADRNALVSQAKKNFNKLLPELSAIDLTKEKEDNTTRLVFSTYPTIINKIDRLREEEQRFYGVGHFDLIIIDEAHRSVYHKYRAIFEYFDALLIGLTATPKKDIDRNTYQLFGIEDDNPTYAYELNQAVQDGFLVPPKSISVPLKFQREGIKYADLSAAEKEEYEEKFGDPTTEVMPEAIDSSALNKWLFNADTVDKVLDHLMNEGIKVQGGDVLGKTIIFAKNHAHAVFVEDRFNKNYPEYSGKFLRVIDNYETKAEDLLEKFVDEFEEVDPQIAVSVDMMDTGVDAPRVVNLVFFKMVKSAAKFWQMIGRGTRLCSNLFGPGEDKAAFLIFDYCQNFEFFDEYPDGIATKAGKPLQQQIFEAKLRVAQLIAQLEEKTEEEIEVRASYLSELHKIVSTLDESRFEVRKQLRYVHAFQDKNKWLDLSKSAVQEIRDHLSHLQPILKGDDELARRFDMLVLSYQVLLLTGTSDPSKFVQKIYNTAVALEKKGHLPQIKPHLPLLQQIQSEHYWETINVKRLDELRQSLRDLIKHLDKNKQTPVYTHFIDEIDHDSIAVREPVNTYIRLQSYKERVESYIRNNKHHLAIKKLHSNIPITAEELQELEDLLFTEDIAGTQERFVQEYGQRPLGAFIRSITGLDQQALNEAFAEFLHLGHLRADQMTFIKTIISFLCKNGVIDKAMLFEPPFTDIHDQGLFGVFSDELQIRKVVRIIDSINGNASVA